MYGLVLDKGPEFRAQGLVSDQIDGSAESVFEVELHAEVPVRRSGTIERNEDIDVAVFIRRIAGGRTKQGEPLTP